MGYVGNSPAEKYTTIDKQVITGNGTVGPYTLTHSVGNEQEIEVFVNNVRQEPGIAYTVSANQLTMGGTVAAADDFYIVFQGKAKMTATHPPTFDLNAANGTFTGNLTVDTNTLYVDSTNNRVGVGTASPATALDVTGTTATSLDLLVGGAVVGNAGTRTINVGTAGSVAGGVQIWAGTTQTTYLQFGDEAGTAANHYRGFLSYNHSTDSMQLGTASAERMRIDTTGNVGIGKSPVSAMLDVNGNVKAGNGTASAPAYSFQGSSAIGMYTPDSGFSVAFGTGGSERLRIDSSGNLLVGKSVQSIGTVGVTVVSGQVTATADGADAIRLNRKTSNGSIIDLRKDGTTVGSIGSEGGDSLYIVSGDTGLRFAGGSDVIIPVTTNGAARDNAIDLGSSGARFKDLYLSGGIVFGATGGAVTSKTLDDYEEGIWYPVLKASTTNPTYGATNDLGYYVKIGNMVYVTWYSSVLNITNSGSGGAQIGGLPFTAASGSQEYWLFNYQHGTGISGTNTSGGYVERNNTNLIFIQQGTVLNSTWVQLNSRYVMISASYRTP